MIDGQTLRHRVSPFPSNRKFLRFQRVNTFLNLFRVLETKHHIFQPPFIDFPRIACHDLIGQYFTRVCRSFHYPLTFTSNLRSPPPIRPLEIQTCVKYRQTDVKRFTFECMYAPSYYEYNYSFLRNLLLSFYVLCATCVFYNIFVNMFFNYFLFFFFYIHEAA